MKRLFLLLSFLLVSTYSYSQSGYFLENFDYPDGDLITSHGWTAYSGAGTNSIRAILPGLTYTNYPGSGIGNMARMVQTGEDAYKFFDSSIISGNVYASFMVRVDTARNPSGAGDSYFLLLDSTSNTSFYARVWIRDSSTAGTGKFSFGISKNATGAAVLYSPAEYLIGTTYLVVLKYEFITGVQNDQVSLFVFSSGLPGSEPAIPTLGPHVGTTNSDPSALFRVGLRQGGSSTAANLKIDGIYVSDTWDHALPVELSSFTSVINRRDVTLNWTTASETNNSGFEIERSTVSGSWNKIGFVSGNGTSTTPHSYSFVDRGLNSGKYNYRLKQVDFNGNHEYFNLNNEVNVGIPVKFDLSQNYPNPFNPSTKINFDLPYDSKVNIKLFDMSGREVGALVNDVRTAGYYTVDFNASNVSSGVYFYRISAEGSGNNFTMTKKMMLVK